MNTKSAQLIELDREKAQAEHYKLIEDWAKYFKTLYPNTELFLYDYDWHMYDLAMKQYNLGL